MWDFDRTLALNCHIQKKVRGNGVKFICNTELGSANEGLGPEQVFRLSRSNLPYVPDWIRSRAQALDDDAKREEKLTGDGGGEQALLEDLLSALLGIQSKTLILIDDQFRVHPQIFNPALVNVVGFLPKLWFVTLHSCKRSFRCVTIIGS